MEKKLIYLAGAIGCCGEQSTYPKEWRRKATEWFAANTEVFSCIDPTKYYEYGHSFHKTEREIMQFDLRKVKNADVILVNLTDLSKSPGTMDEIMCAWMNDKAVIGFIEDEISMHDIHPWKIEQIDRIETGSNAMECAMEYINIYYS